MYTNRYKSKYYLDAVDIADSQQVTHDLFHSIHEKAILESTLLHNRGHAVALAGGIHEYLAHTSLHSLNITSLAGFDFEQQFLYYSNATTAGPVNHSYIDRIGIDGQTFQDYAGHSWSGFQEKVLKDHQAHQFRITDDFYRWIQDNYPSYLDHHPNIHPASHDLPFSIDSDKLTSDVTAAIQNETNSLWFLHDIELIGELGAESVLLCLLVNRSAHNLGHSLINVGIQQAFVLGTEALIDSVPEVINNLPEQLQELIGGQDWLHGLVEGYNTELTAALLTMYTAGQVILFNSDDLTKKGVRDILTRRVGLRVTSYVSGHGVVFLFGIIFTPLGPGYGTAIGMLLGTAASKSLTSLFKHWDKVTREENEERLARAIDRYLSTPPHSSLQMGVQ